VTPGLCPTPSCPALDVLHTAIEVRDIETTRSFHEDLLGLEHTRDYERNGVRNHYVGGADAGPSGAAELQFREVDDPADPAGIDPVAVAADDVDATVERAVEEWGDVVEQEPRTLERVNRRLAILTDPDGYTVHLIEDL
jgi:lactoylglutathione lyase